MQWENNPRLMQVAWSCTSLKYISVFLELNTKSKEILFILMRVASRTCIENPVTVLPVAGSLTITVKRVLYSQQVGLICCVLIVWELCLQQHHVLVTSWSIRSPKWASTWSTGPCKPLNPLQRDQNNPINLEVACNKQPPRDQNQQKETSSTFPCGT